MGLKMKKFYNFCKTCNKGINYYSIYCRKCYDLNRLINKVINICKLCGIKISKKSKHCIKCNGQIQSKNLIGKNNPNYKKGNYCNNQCIDCNKLIKQQRKRCKMCDIKWRKQQFIKSNNPNWKGGIGRLPYSYDFKYNRKLVLKRDNYTCLKCGKKGNHVHHIDYNKQNSKLNNLATTCKKCNCEVNANRDYWYAYFTYIMETE